MAATAPGVSAAIMQRLSEVYYKPESPLFTNLVQLFEERPMWTRVALLNQFPMAERRDIFKSVARFPDFRC